jgi:hypothetical protein
MFRPKNGATIFKIIKNKNEIYVYLKPIFAVWKQTDKKKLRVFYKKI